MSIIRTEHNKNNPYVILNKSALEDSELSWAAKGLWAYLMSRPDNWNVSVAHLSSIYKDYGGGEKAIYALLSELIEKGYCQRKQDRSNGGKFNSYEYIITEFKIISPHLLSRNAVPPRADPPDTVNRATNNNDCLTSNECITNNNNNKAVDDDFPEKKSNNNKTPEIKFSDPEKEQLNNYTSEQIAQAYEITNRDCIQRANHSRVKFFFKVLENLKEKPANKPKPTPYEILSKQFKSYEVYGNGRQCFISNTGIGFSTLTGYDHVDFPFEYFSWDKFDAYCKQFNIKYTRE